MTPIILILTVLTLFAVVGVLLLGLVTLLKGGELSKKYGNKLMRLRVILQAVCLALLASLWILTQ
ncbi:MAG: twin transmembrane helix small protein [Alphaproteobacteria bacterium]|nr:twin transmembrane helix small protein [Alphaproteobacteria bacterium]OIN87001.1 MAG: hypothetical protein AUJ12_03680 [Alphaproteobacteria bacterium CG1_02_46_17]